MIYVATGLKVFGGLVFLGPLLLLASVAGYFHLKGIHSEGAGALVGMSYLLALVASPVGFAIWFVGFIWGWATKLSREVDAERALAAKKKSESP